MKSFFQNIGSVLVLAFVLASCSNKGPAEARYIPKTSSVVVALDPAAMKEKMQKGGISIDTLLHKIFTSDSLDAGDRKKFDEFRTTAGINWDSRIFFFMSQKGNPATGQTISYSILSGLSDAKAFESYLQKQEKLKEKAIEKGEGYSYLLAENGTMLSWNKTQVIVTMYSYTQKPVFDTTTFEYQEPIPVNTDSLIKKEVETYYTQKKSASIADVAIFTDLFKEKADGYMFSSSSNALSVLSMLPFSMPKIDEFVKDNYSAATLSFEEGKIVAKSASYTNPLLSNVLKKYAGPKVDLSMIEYYPSEHINGIMLASFNPEIFNGFLQQLELEGLVNTALEKQGFSSTDVFKILKGDIAVIISDLEMHQPEPQNRRDEKSLLTKRPFGKLILSAPIGDKASYTKIMDKAVERGFFRKDGDLYKSSAVMNLLGLYFQADGKDLILASDSLTFTQYIAKTKKAVVNPEVLARFKNMSTAFYFDIAGTLNTYLAKETPGTFDKSMQTAKETFKDIIATTENFDGKSIKGTFEVRLQNETQNSLVTLTSLFTNIAIDMRVAARASGNDDKIFPAGIPAIIRTN